MIELIEQASIMILSLIIVYVIVYGLAMVMVYPKKPKMKLNRFKYIRDRLYEIYFYLGLDGFVFAVVIADIDFQIHLQDCRKSRIEEERIDDLTDRYNDEWSIPYGEDEYYEHPEEGDEHDCQEEGDKS